MILSPEGYPSTSTYDLLRAAALGQVPIDRRFLRVVLERGEAAIPDLLRFFTGAREDDRIDIDADLLAMVRHWRTPAALPFLAECARQTRFEIPDVLTEAFVELGAASVDTLLGLYEESGRADDVLFVLASLRKHDPRILAALVQELETDPLGASLNLGIYGDPAARPAIEEALAKTSPEDELVRRELAAAIEEIERTHPAEELTPFDTWADYPEESEPYFNVLDPAELLEFLASPDKEYRIEAVRMLANGDIQGEALARILELAKSDPDVSVRAEAWEALEGSLEEPGIHEALMARLEDTATPIEERCGALVALAIESREDPAIRQRIVEFYAMPEARAQAIKAMWHTVDRRFADYIPGHLDDPDPDVRRQSVIAVGWLGIVSQIGRLQTLFDDEQLRDEALFAYALAAPGGNSPAHLRKLLRKIVDLAGSLSHDEDWLVRKALDDRLQMHGQKPVFQDSHHCAEEEEAPPATPAPPPKAGRNDPCPCGSGKKFKKCCGQ